jgi:hypothetical protein
MMKNYPRIYSLSTLGLIHHQEFDYNFHPFRTDFIGESGVGKSMIADLLQLIFVGSDAFESATKATGERKPSGMVLEEGGRGRSNSTGYAFLNIETGPQEYLVIGTCIETGNRNTHCFIIQAGFDYSPVRPLNQALTYLDFLKNEEILPIDLLKEHISERGFFCESWQKPKKYHEILFRENILPLDLASNDRLIKDYAGILQSFSRGKTLDTQKGSSLKDFLFGRDKAAEINNRYKQAVTEMEATIGEYGNNLKEIERVTQKQRALIDLKKKKEVLETAQLDWLTKSMAYCDQQKTNAAQMLDDNFHSFKLAEFNVSLLTEIVAEAEDTAKSEQPFIEEELQQVSQKMELIRPENMKIVALTQWLIDFDCGLEGLRNRFRQNQINSSRKNMLDAALIKMTQEGIDLTFRNIIGTQSSFPDFIEYLEEQMVENNAAILEKEKLVRYTDIENSNSLAYWAFLQKRDFTLEEESIVLKLQELPRDKNLMKSDFLPYPDELFAAIQISEKEENGFWLNLNGVRKYIPYVPSQILGNYDAEKIRSFFAAIGQTTGKVIDELKQRVDQLKKIKKIWLSFQHAQEILDAYHLKDELEAFVPSTTLSISSADFETYLECYLNKDEIKAAYDNLVAEKTLKDEQLITCRTYLAQIKALIADLNKVASKIANTPLFLDIGAYVSTVAESTKDRNAEKLLFVTEELPDLAIIREAIRQVESSIRLAENWAAQQLSLDNARDELEKTCDLFRLKYPKKQWENTSVEYLTEPKSEKETFNKAEQIYLLTFKNIIENYIPSEAFKFQDDDNFFALSKSLLPEAFAELVTTGIETSEIETIQRYLIRINDKNRQLNDRKIQKIKDLLDEVDNAITIQMDVVRRIDNFLKAGHSITGGYHARLKRDFAAGYPKEWMDNFKQKIEQEIGLFAPSGGLTDRLSEKVSLNEMMLEAFYFCGGSKGQEVTINKLLDPSMYYDLNFTMESETGRVNKGSTGQTYAAIALLCIARLSVMSREEGKNFSRAVRVMPIDEAEGLGSNYDMLYEIAREFDYQIISLSINPVGKFIEGDQYIYMLHKNMEVEAPVNYRPMAIFFEQDINAN